MKQESSKKTPKWLLPVIIAAAVLVVVGIALAIFLPTLGGEDAEGTIQSKLYWNVDRLANTELETGMSTRTPGSDGMYAIRFAVGGEQVEYKCTDKRLVNAIDLMDVMGLVFDENGLIVDAVDPKVVATEVAKDVFTKSYNGSILEANSSQAMNGMPIRAEIAKTTGVWDVSPTAEVVGQKGEPALLDMISIYADANGVVTDVFIVKRAKEAGVYYLLDRSYDATLGATSRLPDENGVYTMLFAHEGEQVELKCKDVDLVSSLDALSDSKLQMGLLFDEEGYIAERVPVVEAIKGKALVSMYDVTIAAGNMITAESKWSTAKDKGEIVEFEIPEECDDIFLMETNCGADFAGQRVESLQVGDRVYVYSDFSNNPLLIFITHRGQDYPIYYNLSRKYDSEKKETTRTPENGYYVFKMATAGGKTVTLKTDNKDLATRVDKFSPQYMGLKVENGIILNACDVACVAGRSGLGNRYVTEMMGTICRFASASDLTSGSNLILAQGCKFYDLTGAYGVPMMSETTVQLGDRVAICRTPGNEVAFGFVLDRYVPGIKIYENVGRKYSSKLESTTREPDENGYYVFDMLCEGKSFQLKTKDKKLATYIDKASNRFLGLKVSGDIIKMAYTKFYCGYEYGNRTMSGVYFDYIDKDGKIHYYTESKGVKTLGQTDFLMADDCVIYNNSEAYEVSRGEKTKLQKGDYIYCVYTRNDRKIQRIFVRTREVNGPLYWPISQKYNSTTKETTRTPDAEGYYNIELFADGQIKTYKTKSKDVASRVDAYAYAFGMKVKGDTIVYPVVSTYVKGIEEHRYRFTYVKQIKGNTVITETIDPTSDNYGKDLELKFTKNSKIYDVCTYSDGFGKATTITIGDRLVSYVDKDKNVVYCFVDRKCTREAGSVGMCEHCGKEVTWTPFVGTIDARDMHYYLPNDRSRSTRTIGYTAAELAANSERKQYKTCFDLNGHTLTSPERNFTINSTLNVMDSVGGGKLVSGSGPSLRLSFSGGAEVNVYGGTFEKSADAPAVTGALIYGGSCTVNIYDGTFIGGNAPTGGIAHMGTGSTLNIEGGTFVSGTAANGGNSIYILNATDAPSTLAMRNCKIDGGIYPSGSVKIILGSGVEIGNAKGVGIALSSGQKLDVSKMDTTTSVYVTANGVFTTERDDIATLETCFKPAGEHGAINVDGKALSYEIVVEADPETDTQKRVEKWVAKVKADGAFAADGELPITCPICNGVGVTWEAKTGGFTTAVSGGHYYFSNEGAITYNSMNLIATSFNGEKACIYLNDHDISIKGRIRLRGGEMNIFGDGSITKVDNDSENKAMPLLDITTYESKTATLNVYGGNYTSQVSVANVPAGVPVIGISAKGRGTTVNVYGGSFTMADGTAGATLHSAVGGDFNLYGGTVNSGAAGAINADTATVLIQDMALQGVNLTGQSMLTLVGNVQIPADKGGLTLAEGAFADVSQLNAASSIVVSATGVFTTENEAAGAVKDCFLPADPEDTIVCDGYTLSYQAAGTTPPSTPDPDPAPTEPGAAEKAAVDAWVAQVKADGAFAEGGTLPTTCPFCDGAVTWEAKSGSFTTANSGGHYYFSNNGAITYNSMNLIATTTNGVKACIYLNDHDISIKGRIRLRGGEMNLFGDGNITKVDNDSDNKAMPLLNVTTHTGKTATLNIYGGTYTAAVTAANVEAGVPVIGVTGVGAGTAVNIYGGTFTVAQGALGKAIDSTLDNATTIYNGTFNGDINLAVGSLTVHNGNFNGQVSVAENTVLNLSGKPVIAGLTLNGAAVANIDGLKPDARITVNAAAGKVLTAASDNAEVVKDCFLLPGGLKLENVDNTLVVKANELNPAQNVIDWVTANGAAFRAEDKLVAGATVSAPCPFCSPDANVTWTAARKFESTAAGAHLYQYEAYNASSTNFITTSGDGAARCVYLNGFDATSDGLRIRGKRDLSIIAYGSTLTRTTKADGSSNTAGFVQGEGSFRIYGGTFISNDPTMPVVRITSITNVMGLYDATFVNNSNSALTAISDPATLGTVSISNCTFTGAAASKAIKLDRECTLNISGSATTVTGGMELAENVTVNVTGNPSVDSGLPAVQQASQNQEESSQSVKS